MKLYYSPDYIRSKHAFDTTRKAGWIADDLRAVPIANVAMIEPLPLTCVELEALHDATYIEAVRTGRPVELAESQGFDWDPGLWRMVCASNGGAVHAAFVALTERCNAGSLSSGLHHARRGAGAGFCTFNGVALAAKAALGAGAARVLILDLDAHCGGGTDELVGADRRIRIIDVSTSAFDDYAPQGANTLDVTTGAEGPYMATVIRRLQEANRFLPDLCIYNAGMDPFGALSALALATREALVFKWAASRRVPVAFVLAGGYTGANLTEAGLVRLHRMTIEAAARGDT